MESFERLIAWLSRDPELAGDKYKDIYDALLRNFHDRGCAEPHDLVEETISRVANKVEEIADIYVGDPKHYFYGVAKKVYMEYLEDSKEPEHELPEENTIPPEQEFVALVLVGDRIRAASLSRDGYRFLDDTLSLHNLIYVASAQTSALQTSADELETLINDPNCKEEDFQDFFERNPWFILSDEYKEAHSHIVLASDNSETLIPDFVLEPIEKNALCDLLELKLPSAPVYVLQRRRMRFSAAVLEACAQLRTYSQFFDEERNRKCIEERYGLLAYRPKLFVIIGRRGNLNPIEVRKIESDIPNLTLRTYDDVLNRVKFRIDAMKTGAWLRK